MCYTSDTYGIHMGNVGGYIRLYSIRVGYIWDIYNYGICVYVLDSNGRLMAYEWDTFL